MALEYQNTTSVNVVMAESKVPYLKFRFEYLAFKYILKSLFFKGNLVIASLDNLKDTSECLMYQDRFGKSLLLKCYELTWFQEGLIYNSEKFLKYQVPYFSLFYKPRCDLSLGREIKNSEYPRLLFREASLKDNFVDIFTDGSKIADENVGGSSVGFAVWSDLQCFNKSFKLPDSASVFSAECFALIEALKSIPERVCEDFTDRYRIFTDSQSIVKSLSQVNGLDVESPLLVEIRERLYSIALKGIYVNICWIPSHVGIDGNERVDSMAKEAAMTGSLMNIGIPYTDLVVNYLRLLGVK